MTTWFAVHTQPQKEATAKANLLRQGFNVYLPLYLKKRRHARRIDFVPAPLFPRYLFVGGDETGMRWRSISSTTGVANLVCFGDRPSPVPREIIQQLKATENGNGMVSQLRKSQFNKGDIVQFLHGAFGDVLATIQTLDPQDRVTLLLSMLGRKVEVQVPMERIAAAV